jgi:PAS domain S-box-containing protein
MRETDRPILVIVDDEPMALNALQQALQSKFGVLPAHSGPEALELLRSRPVQVLVADQRMPGMSGVEVLAAARAERPEVARVMLTGYTDLHDLADAVNLGGVEYIVTKPWNADELVEVLERAAAMARRAEIEIAERRQAEAAAHRAEANLTALIENSDTSIWSVDRDYRLLAFNTRFREGARQGLGREISIGENILPEVPEAIREEWTRHYDRCLRGESFRMVTPTVPPLPPRIDEYRFNPIRLAGGQVAGLTVFANDVTERKQAEAALREKAEALRRSEAKFRAVVENSNEGILFMDAGANILYRSPSCSRINGHSDEERLGRSLFDPVHPDDLETVHRYWAEVVQHPGRALKADYRIRHKDGTWRWIETATQNLLGNPNIQAIVSAGRDITERKQAEEEVQRQAARAEALVQMADRLNGQLDLDRTLQAVCEETTRALNVPVAIVDLYDQRRRELCYAADVGLPAELRGYALPLRREALASSPAAVPANAGLLAALNSPATAALALRRDDELIGAVRVFAADGARQFTVDELALLRGLADHASQVIMNARLYEQVRAGREQLQMLSRQLVQAQETERQALAHELHDQIGQNLTGLSLNLNILRSQLSAEAAAPLRRRLDDSLALVSETMQRVRNVMAELRPPALDDYGLLAALRWHGEQLTARTGLKVRVEGAELTPRLSPPEENALFRIAKEALTNAIKHAAATQAVITLEAEPGLIRLTVEDNGGGFNPAGRRRPGSQGGWGLTFMRERAIAIGGQLHVESASGQGTRIVVEVRR